MRFAKPARLALCLTVLLGSLAWPTPARAQGGGSDGHGTYWRHYNTANSDLSSNNICAVAYTEDPVVDIDVPGLWIGTDEGLSYTNGRDWVNYTVANSDIPTNTVQAIIHGQRTGELWIATASGVARLDYGSTPRDRGDDAWEVFTPADGLPAADALSLALGREGELWAGTAGGVARYDGATWRAYTDGLPAPEIRDLAYDAGRDGIWIATGDGVGLLDLASETWTTYQSTHSQSTPLPSNDVRALAVNSGGDGRVWIGTAGGLATLSRDDTWETWIPRQRPGLPKYPITDLSLNPTGRYLWIATDGGGASRYDILADHWTRLNTLGSDLPDDHVQIVLASHENTAWLATPAGLSGVERPWETHSFYAPRVPGRLPGSRVQAGWTDPHTGAIWVATDSVAGQGCGVSRSDDGGATWQTFTTAQGLGDNDVRAVWGDGAGAVWVGTADGVSRSDDGGATWQTFTADHGLGSNSVSAVGGDRAGAVWVGTYGGGVSRSDDGGATWQTFTADHGLGDNSVTAVWGDGAGAVWVGTYGGVSRSDDGGATWQTFTADQGLGYNSVSAVWGDGAGAVWVGTYGGVSRSDDGGASWQTFTTDQGLGSNSVSAVWGDGAGDVWVGTYSGGVSRSDDGGATWQTFTSAQGLGSDSVRAAWGDGAGAVWIGTYGGGVSRSDDGGATWQTFTSAQGLGSDSVRAMWGDGAGTVWVGTDGGGVNRSDDGGATWQIFTGAQGLGSDSVRAMWVDGAGTAWVGTYSGVFRSDDGGATWQTLATAQDLGDNSVSAVWEDGAGAVWVGTWGGGVSRSDDGGVTWQTLTTDLGLGSDYVWAAWGDGAGAVWVGTYGGVNRSDDGGATWQTFTTAQGLGSNSVRAVWGDGAGAVWVGTYGGVSRSDDGGTTWQTFTTAQGLGSDDVWAVWGDGAGTVWVGTYGGGVSRSDDGGATWQTFTTAQGLGSNSVRAVWGDGAGDVWVGTADGVSRSDDGGTTWQTFTTAQGLGPYSVRAVWGDGAGTVWVGTAEGMSRSDDGGATWQTFTTDQGLGANSVWAVWGDGAGAVWVGTYGGGASRSDDGGATWQTLTTAQGLGSNSVLAVWGDGAGAVWVGTDGGGVSRSDDGGATWQTFTTDQGLGSNDVWAVWGDGAGAVWVGTDDGVSRSDDGGATWQTFTADQGLGSDSVRAAWGDGAGAVWVGTYGGGVSRSDDGGVTWQTFTTAQGLGSDSVRAMWGDGASTVWVGTDGGGVSRLSLGIGAVPAVGWLKPAPLSDGSLFRLVNVGGFEGRFVGLDLAPTGGSDRMEYAVVLSPSAPGRVFSATFGAGEIGAARIAPVFFGTGFMRLPPGEYTLSLTATDLLGQSTTTARTIRVLSAAWLLAGVSAALAMVGTAAVSLCRYPSYAVEWSAARDYPLQQIIPLVAPARQSVNHETLEPALREVEALSTADQVQVALNGLVERGLMRHEEDGGYRFVSPVAARLHRRLQQRHIAALSERVRTQHPLYARTRGFFAQARFGMREISAEEFLLAPQGEDHPQAGYGPMYARLVAGSAPTADDFTAVCQATRRHCGADGDLTHRVALVISDRRPRPWARYRLYEIRQREGLAIVPLDIALFGQVKPDRSANDILAAEIDQATGRQNLYTISGPVSGDLSFFGRERVLEEIVDLLDTGQPVGVFGLRKVGKTSLIQRLQGRLAQRRPIAFVDTQGTVRQQSVWPLYPAIVASLVDHLRHTRPELTLPELRLWPGMGPPSPSVAEDFLHDLAAIHAALGRPREQERTLVIVDEVDRLPPAGGTPGYEGFAALFGQLREANQQARMLDFLLVGVDPSLNRRERWTDHDNELYQALHEVWMPPMAADDVQEMIVSLGLQMGVHYEREALAVLTQSGGGQPFVTRQMCGLAVEGRLDHGEITVTAEQAREAVDEFMSRAAYLGQLWHTRLDQTQRRMLRMLAQAPGPVSRTRLLPAMQRQEALAALHGLEEYTLVRRDEPGYTIAWGVFRDWIRWVELGLET